MMLRMARYFLIGALAVTQVIGECAIAQIDSIAAVPPTRALIADSVKAGVVRITNREAVRDLSRRERPVCGFLLTANVIEPFKGGSEPFKFFLPVASGFKGFEQTYFVIVFAKQGPSPTDLAPPIDPRNKDLVSRARCLALQIYYVPIQFQSVWSFDAEAARDFGGLWLEGAHRADGLLCGFDSTIHRNYQVRTVNGMRIQEGKSRYWINWDDVKQVVKDAVSAHPSHDICAEQ